MAVAAATYSMACQWASHTIAADWSLVEAVGRQYGLTEPLHNGGWPGRAGPGRASPADCPRPFVRGERLVVG